MRDLTKWLSLVLTGGSLVAAGTYAIAQRPTEEKVEHMIEQQTAPVAQAVQQQTTVLREITTELRQLREQAIRDEVRRELEERGK